MKLQIIKNWLRALFPVVIGLFTILFTGVLCWQYWPLDTALTRINFLGSALIIFVVIMGLWYFMNKIESISATILGNEVKIDNGKGDDNGQG